MSPPCVQVFEVPASFLVPQSVFVILNTADWLTQMLKCLPLTVKELGSPNPTVARLGKCWLSKLRALAGFPAAHKLDVMTSTYNPNTQGTEAGGTGV